MIFLLLFLSVLLSPAWSADKSLCDVLDLKNCAGVSKQGRRSSNLSLPSPSTSANMNPATVSFDRGLGVEAIHQSGNPVLFSIASGTGRLGGALISSSLENSFFGNRTIELDEDYLERNLEKKQYKNKKITIALGGKLLQSKKGSLDFGIILKRHSLVKRVNPGVGLSARLGPVTFGASVYQDDYHLELKDEFHPVDGYAYSDYYGKDSYSERFIVHTYSVGTKIDSFSFDFGLIKTKYKFDAKDTEVAIYSAAYIYKDFMFNLAFRNEMSPALKFVNDRLVEQRTKSDVYTGVQVSLGKYFIVGVNYNYFLLREFSLLGTLFF